MTADEVRERLRRACRLAGSAKAWALAQGISPAYVNDVLAARREPGPLILEAFGLTKVVGYTASARDVRPDAT